MSTPSDLRDQIITVCTEKLVDYKVIVDKISKVDLRGRLPANET